VWSTADVPTSRGCANVSTRSVSSSGMDRIILSASIEHELSTSERDSGNLQDACVATVRQAVVPAGMPRAREAHNVPERARSRTKRHA
jgi:hypothetical protein